MGSPYLLQERKIMAKTTVVNLKLESYDVYIGRSGKGNKSIWGNPYAMNDLSDAERDRVVNAYEDYILNKPELLAHIPELVGKRLGCYCKRPGREVRCHGDVLVALVDIWEKKGRIF
jgi:hypothetical protein